MNSLNEKSTIIDLLDFIDSLEVEADFNDRGNCSSLEPIIEEMDLDNMCCSCPKDSYGVRKEDFKRAILKLLTNENK